MAKSSLKKTLLWGAGWQFGAVLIILVSMVVLVVQSKHLIETQQQVISIKESSVTLMMLANEQVMHPSVRVQQQWKEAVNRAKNQLSGLRTGPKDIEYQALLVQFVEIDRHVQRLQAEALPPKVRLALQPALVSQIYNLLALSQQLLSEVENSYENKQKNVLFILGFVSLLALILPLYLLFNVLRKIILPVQSLVASTEVIGQKDFTQPIPKTQLLELDVLVDSMNSMRLTLLNEMALKSDLLTEIEQRALAEKEALKLLEQLKKNQHQMLKMEKLSALGIMVGGVAHELNNPLMGVHNYVEYSLSKVTDPKVLTMLGRAIEEIERMQHLVTNMLIFSRTKQRVGLEDIELFNVVESVITLMEPDFKKFSITVHNQVSQGLSIYSNSDIIKQVLVNLLSNARDALKNTDSREVTILDEALSDTLVNLKVIDTGGGISDKDATLVFDPFYTTKPVGEGTGLGLSISRELMQQLDSELVLERTSIAGTTFSMSLPIAPINS